MSLDPVSIERLSLVYPDIRVRMIRLYNDMWSLHAVQMKCCQGTRTWAEQASLYEQGRTKSGHIVTDSKAGESLHNFGCAVDSCFPGETTAECFLDKDPRSTVFWRDYAKFGSAHGLNPGAFWKKPDKPHMDLAYGLSLHELQALYKFGKLPAVWAKFDQIRGVPIGGEWESVRQKISLI